MARRLALESTVKSVRPWLAKGAHSLGMWVSSVTTNSQTASLPLLPLPPSAPHLVGAPLRQQTVGDEPAAEQLGQVGVCGRGQQESG